MPRKGAPDTPLQASHFSRLDARGRTTIPSAVRQAAGMKAGEIIQWFTRPDGTVVFQLPTARRRALDDLYELTSDLRLREYEAAKAKKHRRWVKRSK
jgi:bifunctional DNA-binding transcriptional regulator/antitoxin component of YhaV-PrlF toxin-antitoxin module